MAPGMRFAVVALLLALGCGRSAKEPAVTESVSHSAAGGPRELEAPGTDPNVPLPEVTQRATEASPPELGSTPALEPPPELGSTPELGPPAELGPTPELGPPAELGPPPGRPFGDPVLRPHVLQVLQGHVVLGPSLRPEEVHQAINEHAMPGMRACYDRAKRSEPTLAARIMTEFVIQADGTATSVSGELTEGGTGPVARRLLACAQRALRAVVFPRPRGGGAVNIRYPFIFVPD